MVPELQRVGLRQQRSQGVLLRFVALTARRRDQDDVLVLLIAGEPDEILDFEEGDAADSVLE